MSLYLSSRPGESVSRLLQKIMFLVVVTPVIIARMMVDDDHPFPFLTEPGHVEIVESDRQREAAPAGDFLGEDNEQEEPPSAGDIEHWRDFGTIALGGKRPATREEATRAFVGVFEDSLEQYDKLGDVRLDPKTLIRTDIMGVQYDPQYVYEIHERLLGREVADKNLSKCFFRKVSKRAMV